jgi:NAD(P)-dependent dehydrogenase (short-subunit alcohol dehydrogenase family)
MAGMKPQSSVVLVTGTSSGIGRACAVHLAGRGFRVFGTRRRLEQATDSFQELAMDVNDDESVARALDTIHQQAGRIDVVVNNAGIGYAGAIEDTAVPRPGRNSRPTSSARSGCVARSCRGCAPRAAAGSSIFRPSAG